MQTNSAFKKIQVIHFAIIFGILIFTVTFLLPLPKLSFQLNFDNILFDFTMVWSVLVFIFHNSFYKNELTNVNFLETPHEKWQKYQTSHLIRMAILEGTLILNIVLLSKDPNYYYTILIAINYLFMFEYHPNISKIATEWHLTEEEIKNL